jgi:hypothetical protein
VQDDRIAVRVLDDRHAADRAFDPLGGEGDALGLQISDQSRPILDLEGNPAAGAGAGWLGVTVVIARQPPRGRSNSTQGLFSPLPLGGRPSVPS